MSTAKIVNEAKFDLDKANAEYEDAVNRAGNIKDRLPRGINTSDELKDALKAIDIAKQYVDESERSYRDAKASYEAIRTGRQKDLKYIKGKNKRAQLELDKSIEALDQEEQKISNIIQALEIKASAKNSTELDELNAHIAEAKALRLNIVSERNTAIKKQAALNVDNGLTSFFDNAKLLYANYIKDVESHEEMIYKARQNTEVFKTIAAKNNLIEFKKQREAEKMSFEKMSRDISNDLGFFFRTGEEQIELEKNERKKVFEFEKIASKQLRDKNFSDQDKLEKNFNNKRLNLSTEFLKAEFNLWKNLTVNSFQVLFGTTEKFFKDTIKTFASGFFEVFNVILSPIKFALGAITFATNTVKGILKDGFMGHFFGEKSKLDPEQKKHYDTMEENSEALLEILLQQKDDSLEQWKERQREKNKKDLDKKEGGLFSGLFGSLFGGLGGMLSGLLGMVVPIMLAITAVVAVFSFVTEFLETDGPFFQKLKGGLSNMMETLLTLPAMLIDWILKDIFKIELPKGGSLKIMMEYVNGFIDILVNLLENLWNCLKGAWDVVMGVVHTLEGIWDIVHGIFTGDMDKILDGIKTIFVDGLSNIISGFYKMLSSIVDQIFGFKPGSTFKALENLYNYVTGFEWLKKPIREAPAFLKALIPNSVLDWAAATPAPAAGGDFGGGGAASDIDIAKAAASTAKREDNQAQKKVLGEIVKTQSDSAKAMIDHSTSISQQNNSNSTVQQQPDTPSYRIPSSQGTELWAAGQVALIG